MDKTEYLMGQRVIVGGSEIGVITTAPREYQGDGKLWVWRPAHGYKSWFDPSNVKPLPGGQL